MTNLRPGLGSCTPNWGTIATTAIRATFLVGFDPDGHAAALVGPRSAGLAPGPVTGD